MTTMFADGSDLPLFSGTPQEITANPYLDAARAINFGRLDVTRLEQLNGDIS